MTKRLAYFIEYSLLCKEFKFILILQVAMWHSLVTPVFFMVK